MLNFACILVIRCYGKSDSMNKLLDREEKEHLAPFPSPGPADVDHMS